MTSEFSQIFYDMRMTETGCQNCFSSGLQQIYEIQRVPVHSVILLETRQQALEYPTGDICLVCCPQCGFISNSSFVSGLQEYHGEYESTQSYSPTFDDFSRSLASKLIDRYDLRGKAIIEIGCGMGEFLTLLCELGHNRGIGFDPAYLRGRVKSRADVQFIKDFYSEKYAHYKTDFLICKMTLEHIADPAQFVKMIRRSLAGSPDAVIFFQVPDTTRILREVAFWDIYYEHCSYFTPGSLARLFRQNGFEILDLRREYADQYILIETQLRTGETEGPLALEDDLEAIQRDAAFFKEKIEFKLEIWRGFLSNCQQRNARAVLWGAGSKGVAFLTTLGVFDEIEFCVDINPHKHGAFIAGTGQEIVSPEFLCTYQPEVVIAMNPIYREEIGRSLAHLQIDAELLTVKDIPHD